MPASSRTRTAPWTPAGHTLRADAAASYLRMIAAGMPAGGVDVFMRTMAEQEALYRRYLAGKGPIAARPVATAPHIDGRAIDLHTTTAGKYDPSPAHVWLTAGGDGPASPRRARSSEPTPTAGDAPCRPSGGTSSTTGRPTPSGPPTSPLGSRPSAIRA